MRSDARKRLAWSGPVTESVTAKVDTLSIDYRDYTPEARALYEGSHMAITVHVPIKYAKHLTLSSSVNIEIEVSDGSAS